MLVAICDDESSQRAILESFFPSQASGEKLEICQYDSGEKLIADYEAGTVFDIVFLDIIMDELSGLETARRLRKMDQQVLSIMLTGLLDYAMDGYEVGAFRYLVKPLLRSRFDEIFGAAVREVSTSREPYYAVHLKEGTVIKLNINNMVYLESFGRKITFHMTDGEYNITSNISVEEENLKAYQFLRIHKSFLVNMRFIRQIGHGEVVLEDGKKLPLSRKRYKEVYDTFTQYLVQSSV